MINLKNLIRKLDDETYSSFAESLVQSKADKFLVLLTMYRENNHTENEVIEALQVKTNTFYTLKSRLFEKIQTHLVENIKYKAGTIGQQIFGIPHMLFNDRDIAIATLKKLEKDMEDYDFPHELITIYAALKKLHIHSDKYYDYSRLYNTHVAYTLAADKLEDLLDNFNVKLAEYYVSRNSNLLSDIRLIKQEAENVCNLYKSHHLYVYNGIIKISCTLFLPLYEDTKEDEPVEDIVEKANEIFLSYPNDSNYPYLKIIYNYLSFEYYHHFKLHKKETQFFEVILQFMPGFLFYSHTVFAYKFLDSKTKYYLENKNEARLYEESITMAKNHKPDEGDIPGNIMFYRHLAIAAYYAGKYKEAIQHLNHTLNSLSLKNYTHAEIETKLFLIICFLNADKYDQPEVILSSVSRKIREVSDEYGYENAKVLVKILTLMLNGSQPELQEKLTRHINTFKLLNQGPNQILDFLKPEEDFASLLLK